MLSTPLCFVWIYRTLYQQYNFTDVLLTIFKATGFVRSPWSSGLYICWVFSILMKENDQHTSALYLFNTNFFPSEFFASLHLAFRLPYKKPACISPLPHTCHMPTNLILFDLIHKVLFGEECNLWCSLLCTFIQLPITTVFSPNTFRSILFSNTLSLYFSFNFKGIY